MDPLVGFTIDDVKSALARVTDEVLLNIQVLRMGSELRTVLGESASARPASTSVNTVCPGQAGARFTACILYLTRLHNPQLSLLKSVRSQKQICLQHLVCCVLSACKNLSTLKPQKNSTVKTLSPITL